MERKWLRRNKLEPGVIRQRIHVRLPKRGVRLVGLRSDTSLGDGPEVVKAQ